MSNALIFEIIPQAMANGDTTKHEDYEHVICKNRSELEFAFEEEARKLTNDALPTFQSFTASPEVDDIKTATFDYNGSRNTAFAFLDGGNSGGFYYRLSNYKLGKHS